MSIEYGFNPKGPKIMFDMATKSYIQENPNKDYNPHRLTITLLDQGAGPYLMLKTSGWPIDNAKELLEIIDDFCNNNKIPLNETTREEK
jgi:hypothetical protein